MIGTTLTPYDRYLRTTSGIAFTLCISFAAIIIALLLLVMGYLTLIGFSSVSLSFFTDLPSGHVTGDIGGMKQALVGTCILILLASVVGVPVGVLAGVYLSEYEAGSWFATPVRFVCDVLAGVPSIVVGILGYELLVVPFSSGELLGLQLPFLTQTGMRFNGYAGALALAFIMIPIVARTTEEMLRLIPNSYREAAVGLGATKAQTIIQVVVPAATGSMITGIMLAIARVAGETAPLLFTALGSRLLTLDPSQPFPSLTVQIFNYATSPYPEQNEQAWAGILILIMLIFVLNLAIRFFASRAQVKG